MPAWEKQIKITKIDLEKYEKLNDYHSKIILIKDKSPFYIYQVIEVSTEDLIINDYNCLIKDLIGLTVKEFLSELKKYFEIIPKISELVIPINMHHLVMYLYGKFYNLFYKTICRTLKS